jgi:RimJ/RimL family protein N-acetyltransferase
MIKAGLDEINGRCESSFVEKGTEFISGDRVYLRPLMPEDLNEGYVGWLNDPEVTRYTETGIFPSTVHDLESFYREMSGSRNHVILAIADKNSNEHIGNVKLGPINWIHRRATFGILIGNKDFWSQGFGEESTRLMVEYGFGRLNLHRIDLGVFAEHEAAVRCYQKIGFQIEGRLRDDLFQAGEYKDRLWMGLLKSEYVPSLKVST